MELFERIRRDHAAGKGIREIARERGVHRRTVREAIASPIPPERKTPVRAAPKTDPLIPIIRGWLVADLDVRPKQRHTARRVWQRLVEEHGADVAETTIRPIVARLRAEIAAEQAARAEEVMIVQVHEPGARGEVDFGEFDAFIGGVLMTLQLFVMRLACSGKGYARAYLHQAQEAFFDGHVRAFAHFGGVPGQLAYDNLKAAVAKVMLGRARTEQERFVTLRSHYLFDSFYCRPGIEGAHEKGGVEGEVGRFRRRHLVPVPSVASLAELNALIEVAVATDDDRVITGRRERVFEAFTAEQPHLRPLPAEAFDVARYLRCVVDTKSRVAVRQAYYSVPVGFIGQRLDVRLDATTVTAYRPGGREIVATHDRQVHKYGSLLTLDHYLPALTRKPGALAGSLALAQARAQELFTEAHQALWDLARRRHGDGEGTRMLIEVLLLHRRHPHGHVIAGIDAALAAGSADVNLVALETRRHADAGARLATVIRLPDRVPTDDRPAPTLFDYDTLLPGRSKDTA
ncbi:MAG TPA: IS21 family transposase [Euzebya sp.]|nr:IS21 family transposase [Euzebya sp.]